MKTSQIFGLVTSLAVVGCETPAETTTPPPVERAAVIDHSTIATIAADSKITADAIITTLEKPAVPIIPDARSPRDQLRFEHEFQRIDKPNSHPVPKQTAKYQPTKDDVIANLKF